MHDREAGYEESEDGDSRREFVQSLEISSNNKLFEEDEIISKYT